MNNTWVVVVAIGCVWAAAAIELIGGLFDVWRQLIVDLSVLLLNHKRVIALSVLLL